MSDEEANDQGVKGTGVSLSCFKLSAGDGGGRGGGSFTHLSKWRSNCHRAWSEDPPHVRQTHEFYTCQLSGHAEKCLSIKIYRFWEINDKFYPDGLTKRGVEH